MIELNLTKYVTALDKGIFIQYFKPITNHRISKFIPDTTIDTVARSIYDMISDNTQSSPDLIRVYSFANAPHTRPLPKKALVDYMTFTKQYYPAAKITYNTKPIN